MGKAEAGSLLFQYKPALESPGIVITKLVPPSGGRYKINQEWCRYTDNKEQDKMVSGCYKEASSAFDWTINKYISSSFPPIILIFFQQITVISYRPMNFVINLFYRQEPHQAKFAQALHMLGASLWSVMFCLLLLFYFKKYI